MGNFLDHDPYRAFVFIETVFRGCHDLVILEEYEEAHKILEQVLCLEFHIVDHAETDDSCADTLFDLKDADRERLLSVDNRQLLQDYIQNCIQMEHQHLLRIMFLRLLSQQKMWRICRWNLRFLSKIILIQVKENKTSLKKMSEVLLEKDYKKVEGIVLFLEKNGVITPNQAEQISGKSSATVRRYLRMLVDT